MTTAIDLTQKRCVSCEGPGYRPARRSRFAPCSVPIPDWKLTPDGKRIRREWRVARFHDGA